MKKYKTIIADPPWRYGDRLSPKHGRITYETMSVEEIKALQVNDIAEDGCHLYLWVTNSFIKQGFEILEAWGFTYKTIITWIKPNYLGLGHYWRNNTEHCLFATKGKSKVRRKDMWNVFIAPKRKHSAKPVEFMGCVEEMSEKPRLEMFSRCKRDGWDSWGNEIDSDIEIELNNI